MTSKQPCNYILVAEDDMDEQEILAVAFSESIPDLHQKFVNNGSELMKLLMDNTIELPCILALDINMPHKNGLECLAEIRMQERLKRLPVIIYTNSCQAESVQSAYNLGANFYFPKPDTIPQLCNVLKHVVTQMPIRHKAPKAEFVLGYTKIRW